MPDDEVLTENDPTENNDTDPTENEGEGGEGGDTPADDTPAEEEPETLVTEPNGRTLTSNLEEIDYVDSDGILHLGVSTRRVMITSENDLAELPDGIYPPGSEAFLVDESGKWRLAADGTWTSLIPEDNT